MGYDTTRIAAFFDLGDHYIDKAPDSVIHYYSKALAIIDSNLAATPTTKPFSGKTLIRKFKDLRFRALVELGTELFYQGKYAGAIDHYNKAHAVAEETGDIGQLSEIYGSLGIVFKNQGNYALALEYYEKALSTALLIGDTSWIAACYTNAGNVYRRITNYSRAADYFLRAVDMFGKTKETRRISICYMNLGNLFEDQNDLEKALGYYRKAMEIGHETEDHKRIAECLMNIGNISITRRSFGEARELYNKALQLIHTYGLKYLMGDCLKHIGLTYEKEGDFDHALKQYNNVCDIATEAGDILTLSEVFGYLANVYIKQEKYQEGLEYAKKSLVLAKEAGDPQLLKNAYGYLCTAYEKTGNTHKALEYHKLYSDIKDTIFSSEKYKTIRDLEIKYETEKKEHQLELLTKQNEVQRLMLSRRNRLLTASFLFLIPILVAAYVMIRNNRLKEKQKSLEIEQKLLRSQMNPHFIFNSLIAIQSFIYNKEPAVAGDYLAKFAELIRITLENSRNEFVLLEKEIRMLNIFLELQALRFENRFSFRIEPDSAIDPAAGKVPPMLAQPFLENAIEHGLKDSAGDGLITIGFIKKDGHIRFTVEDNGIGRERAKERKTNINHQSMATSITRERLENMGRKLNRKYELVIEDLKDEKGRASGTRVSFDMPFVKLF